jgi:hypothetical protein
MEFFTLNYILKLAGAVLIILALMTFLRVSGLNEKKEDIFPQPKITQVATIETMDTINNSPASDFCMSLKGKSDELNNKCQFLTKKNCGKISCCGWLNDSTCVAGDASGPTYQTTTDGTKIPIDSYYYENKCYGPKC